MWMVSLLALDHAITEVEDLLQTVYSEYLAAAAAPNTSSTFRI